MAEGLQVGLTNPGQQISERPLVVHFRPQYQRIDEEPDQPFQVLLLTPGHRGAQHDVLTRTGLGQRHRHSGLHHHQQRATRPPRHRENTLMRTSVQVEPHRTAHTRGLHRTGPIQRQGRNLGDTIQSRTPELEMTGQKTFRILGVTEEISLPEGVVGVLHRQRLPNRGPALHTRLIGRAQILQQHTLGPTIGRDVMHQHHQHRLAGIGHPQPHPQGNIDRQIEDRARELPHQGIHLGGGTHPALHHRRTLRRIHDPLERLTIRLTEHRPQHLVTLDHITYRRHQGTHVHTRTEPQHRRHVVCRTRTLQPIHEPQPALGKGQGDHGYSLER